MTTKSGIGLDSAGRRRRATINYAIFAAVAVVIGWAGIALDEATDQPATNGLGIGLWIIGPLLAAVVLVGFRPDGAGPLGLTLRFGERARWYGFAALVYPVVTALIVMAGIASGLGTFDVSGRSGSLALIIAMAGVLPALVLKNTIEELTWRGFGTRTALATGLPRLGAHVLVGVIWGLWHLPLYVRFMAREDFRALTSLPWPLFIPIFFAGVIVVAVVLGEFRLRTGSIWPGVVMHTVGGAVVNTLIVDGYLGFSGRSDALLSPAPHSFGSILLFGLIGMLLLRQAKARWPNPEHTRKQTLVSDVQLPQATFATAKPQTGE